MTSVNNKICKINAPEIRPCTFGHQSDWDMFSRYKIKKINGIECISSVIPKSLVVESGRGAKICFLNSDLIPFFIDWSTCIF